MVRIFSSENKNGKILDKKVLGTTKISILIFLMLDIQLHIKKIFCLYSKFISMMGRIFLPRTKKRTIGITRSGSLILGLIILKLLNIHHSLLGETLKKRNQEISDMRIFVGKLKFVEGKWKQQRGKYFLIQVFSNIKIDLTKWRKGRKLLLLLKY